MHLRVERLCACACACVCAYHVIAQKNRLNPSIIHICRVQSFCALFSILFAHAMLCLLSVHSNPFIYHIYHVEFTLRLDVHKWRCKWISILRTHNTNGKSDCSSSCFVCRAHTAICQLHNDTLIYLYSIWYIEAMLMLKHNYMRTRTCTHRGNYQIDRQTDK